MSSVAKNLKDHFQNNKLFLVFIILLVSTRWSIADHYFIPTGSMNPNIETKDHIFVNKMAYDLRIPFTKQVIFKIKEPKKGDIVVFENPKNKNINFVKRLIALPGDIVEVEDGFVKVNGKSILMDNSSLSQIKKKLAMGYSAFKYYESLHGKIYLVERNPQYLRKHYLKFIVPENKYFMMGDNRDMSSDSRSWGFVPRGNILGEAKLSWSGIKRMNF